MRSKRFWGFPAFLRTCGLSRPLPMNRFYCTCPLPAVGFAPGGFARSQNCTVVLRGLTGALDGTLKPALLGYYSRHRRSNSFPEYFCRACQA